MRAIVLATGLSLSMSAANAATLTTLANFAGTNGAQPFADLILDPAGNLYGTTSDGGAYDGGTVFKLDTTTGTMTTLASFNRIHGNGAYSPHAGLIADSAGNLFGTTFYGGYDVSPGYQPGGTVFKLDPTSGAMTTLTSFNSVANGYGPNASLIADASGNLFGTTTAGGSIGGGLGSVFKLDSTGKLTTLVSFGFNGAGGSTPFSSLIRDAAGNLYGTTSGGGAYNMGTVFKLDSAGTLTTLGSFAGDNGRAPMAGLTADADGNMYGTTFGGGASDQGTVFKLDPTGTLSTLASFDLAIGAFPLASLIVDAAGNLYGTTSNYGGGGYGTVFKLESMTGTLATLATFSIINGALPRASLVADARGNLYGTTYAGGTGDHGTVFRLSDTGFDVGAAVPEPASWWLMIAGFSLTGVAVRRRTRRQLSPTHN